MSTPLELKPWKEFEADLRTKLSENEDDAKSAFRLGNLLTLANRASEASHYYDLAWAHHWPGAICLNNQGVSLALAGEARAAVVSFHKAREEDQKCGPAAYNMGIVLERLGEEGSLPELIRELNLAPADISTEELIRRTFAAAGDAEDWGRARSTLDGPLFLWADDLTSGFGFEPNKRAADMRQGEEYLKEAVQHLEAGEWQAAETDFKNAIALHPDLEARVATQRTQAQLAQVKEYRQSAREKREKRDYQGAQTAFEAARLMMASLPDRILVEQVLSEEIRLLGEELRHRKPSPDWQGLQNLVSQVRQRVDDLKQSTVELELETAEQAGSETDHHTAKDHEVENEHTSKGESDTAVDIQEPDTKIGHVIDLSNTADQLRNLCRGAWQEQLRFLTSIGQFDSAELMLDFSEVQWFAQGELPKWRRDLFAAKAESLTSEAVTAQEHGELKEAISWLQKARLAAMEAEDRFLLDGIDRRIENLRERREREEIEPNIREFLERVEELVHDGDFLQAFQKTVDGLSADPDSPRLLSLQESALHGLKDQVREVLRARQWDVAVRLTAAMLETVPEDEEAQELADLARKGRLHQTVSRGRNALDTGDFSRARKHVDKALSLVPDHRPALELRRKVEVASQVDHDAADEEYDSALVAFRQAQAAGEPEQALECLAGLLKKPDEPNTEEAQQWTADALVKRWRTDLAQERTEEHAEALTEKLRRLLNLVPGHPDAIEFREELRRVETNDYSNQRRQKGLDRLAEVRQHLLELHPVEALDLLEEVDERGDPRLSDDVESYLNEALGQIDRRVKRLALKTSLAPEEEEELEDLLAACQTWAPDKAQKIETEIQRRRKEPALRARAESDLRDIVSGVEVETSALAALRKIYRITYEKYRSGSPVATVHQGEIEELLRRQREGLGWLDRWRAHWFERNHPANRVLNRADCDEEGPNEDNGAD